MWLERQFPGVTWSAERSAANAILGYGCKVDLSAPGIVIDFKTKDFDDPGQAKAWPENVSQLAANRVALGMPEAECWNVLISRTTPGLVVPIRHSEEDLAFGWQAFLALLTLWKIRRNYFPGGA
jgi:hypothetical protein